LILSRNRSSKTLKAGRFRTTIQNTQQIEVTNSLINRYGRGTKDQQRQPLTLAIGGYVMQALAHFFEASQLVMLIEQLFEILQFGPFHEPYLDLM
jgi:hypothetical protein